VTDLTPQSRDGGIDVWAFGDTVDGRDPLAIQGKRYDNRPIGVSVIPELLGFIQAVSFITKGV
jgi:hypothetical protein